MNKRKTIRKKKPKMDQITYIIPGAAGSDAQIAAINKYRLVRRKAPTAIENELKILGFNFLPTDFQLKSCMDKILHKKAGNSYQNLEYIIKLEKCKGA